MFQKTGSLEIALQAKGWLTKSEREALFAYARNLASAKSNNTIVNIGVEYGASVVCLAEGVGDTGFVYAIDIDLSKWAHGDRYRGTVVFVESDSYKAALASKDSSKDPWIDILFVDGDHSYNGVKRDLLWMPMVTGGGTAIFHDCYEWPPAKPRTVRAVSPDVNRAVDDWCQTENTYGRWLELDPVDSMRVFRRI